MGASTNTREVLVRELYVKCSLRVRNFSSFGVAASDCCQKSAATAVRMEDGKNMWRCQDHEGVRRVDQSGNVLEFGPVADRVAVRSDQ